MRKFALTAFALMAVGTSGWSSDTKYGVQATLSLPQGSFRTQAVDSNNGYGGGLFVDFHLADGNVLRPRLDFTQYGKATGNFGETRQWSNFSLGADYLYYLSGKPQGFYATLGLAATTYQFRYTFSNTPIDKSYNRLSVSAGLGYSFDDHWEGSLKYTKSSIEHFNPSALNIGVAFKF